MKRFRSVIAGLLALLLMILGLALPGAGNSVRADGIGGTGAAQIPAGTVLIQNKWKSNFLYETGSGIVRYGITNPADTSAHWTVTTENGLSQIQNVKTGHFITLDVLVARSGGTAYRFPLSLAESVLKAAKLPDGTLEFKLGLQGGAELAQLLADAGKKVIY